MKQSLLMAAAAAVSFGFVQPAEAQRVWQDGRWVMLPPQTEAPHMRHDPERWGGHVDGRWYAGAHAPGGWQAYRRPSQGWMLPDYWANPDFRVPDYLNWGLAAPPYGYFWVRYYNDAVLVDDRGRVADWVFGIDWDGGASAYSHSESYSHASVGASYPAPGYDGGIPAVDPNDHYYSAESAGYGYPGGGYAPPAVPAPPAAHCCGAPPVAAPGCASVCGGYAGGYLYVVPTVTTVVVQSGGAVTTRTVTEEIVEETVTTRAISPRPVVRSGGKRVRRYR